MYYSLLIILVDVLRRTILTRIIQINCVLLYHHYFFEINLFLFKINWAYEILVSFSNIMRFIHRYIYRWRIDDSYWKLHLLQIYVKMDNFSRLKYRMQTFTVFCAKLFFTESHVTLKSQELHFDSNLNQRRRYLMLLYTGYYSI